MTSRKKPEPAQSVGIKIGHDQNSVSFTAELLLQILNSNNDQKTKRAAMDCMAKSLSINGLSIQNVSVNMGG